MSILKWIIENSWRPSIVSLSWIRWCYCCWKLKTRQWRWCRQRWCRWRRQTKWWAAWIVGRSCILTKVHNIIVASLFVRCNCAFTNIIFWKETNTIHSFSTPPTFAFPFFANDQHLTSFAQRQLIRFFWFEVIKCRRDNFAEWPLQCLIQAEILHETKEKASIKWFYCFVHWKLPSKILAQIVSFVEWHQFDDCLEQTPRRQIIQCFILLLPLIDFHVFYRHFVRSEKKIKNYWNFAHQNFEFIADSLQTQCVHRFVWISSTLWPNS